MIEAKRENNKGGLGLKLWPKPLLVFWLHCNYFPVYYFADFCLMPETEASVYNTDDLPF